MENRFHSLPPHKRFRAIHPVSPINHQESNTPIYSSLPAKKRKESRDPPSFLTSPDVTISASTATYCLPAKKRICAVHPDFLPPKPSSPFDLNLEYNPILEEDIASVTVNVSKKDEEIDYIRVKKGEEQEDEDGILCAVCQSTDGDPSDPIVFCDGCDLMVHTTCYGNPLINGVPEGDWFCSQCQITDKNKDSSCCLCPFNGGALKPTNNGLWAHIVCALFIPEVFFHDPEGREGIDCSKVPLRRWGKKCYVCRKTKGCAIDCSEENCGLSFHVTCGLKEDLCIEYKEGRNKGAIVAGFCKSHSDLWIKQQGTGKYKIVARNED
ncbi:unnamed protein product [Lactuca virosa]|uniref:PHD-type domain-containing protein n=1 Tax=Lactuca virosa TaxID=75947 RepID=A0AAU9MVN2_9ASTR|nr:unnamed protein product [Lactuca virosa]